MYLECVQIFCQLLVQEPDVPAALTPHEGTDLTSLVQILLVLQLSRSHMSAWRSAACISDGCLFARLLQQHLRTPCSEDNTQFVISLKVQRQQRLFKLCVEVL